MTTITKDEAKQTANIIRQQIGAKALYMLGAKNFSFDAAGALAFRIKGSKKVNYIKITLDRGMDLYNMELGKIWGYNYKVVAEETGLYDDMLNTIIENHTGLYTSL